MAYIDTNQFASLEEAIRGIEIPPEIRQTLALVSVPHLAFDGNYCQGQLVVHKELADEFRWLFNALFQMRFPIHSIIPVRAHEWNDTVSMAANNTSAFNIRRIAGTDRFSMHSYAWALDINPAQNPCFDHRNDTIEPAGARYDVSVPGTLVQDSPVVKLFRAYGWVWGGDWTSLSDYMHFEKRLDGARS